MGTDRAKQYNNVDGYSKMLENGLIGIYYMRRAVQKSSFYCRILENYMECFQNLNVSLHLILILIWISGFTDQLN